MTYTGTMSKQMEKLRNSLEACASLPAFLGVPTLDEARKRLYDYSYEFDEGQPFILIDFNTMTSTRERLNGDQPFSHTGQMVMLAQRPTAFGHDGISYQQAKHEFVNDLGVLIDEVESLNIGQNPDRLIILEISLDAIMRPTEDEAQSFGDFFQAVFTITYQLGRQG